MALHRQDKDSSSTFRFSIQAVDRRQHINTIKLNYLTVLAALAVPLVANAEDPRSVPLVACLNEEAVSRSVGFTSWYEADRHLGSDKLADDSILGAADEPTDKLDTACEDAGAKKQQKFGVLKIDAARGTTRKFWQYAWGRLSENDPTELQGVQQECTVTVKDWPSAKKPTLYITDYTKGFRNDADFGAEGDGEGLF